jgi:hypothetical protein
MRPHPAAAREATPAARRIRSAVSSERLPSPTAMIFPAAKSSGAANIVVSADRPRAPAAVARRASGARSAAWPSTITSPPSASGA